MQIYRETYFAPRRKALIAALRRAQAAGVLSPDTDIDVLCDMVAGALMHRLLFELGPGDPTEDVRAYVLRLLKELGFNLAALGLAAEDAHGRQAHRMPDGTQ